MTQGLDGVLLLLRAGWSCGCGGVVVAVEQVLVLGSDVSFSLCKSW